VPITPDNLPDDPAALKRIIAAMAQDALTAQAEIVRLKFQLARYRPAGFAAPLLHAGGMRSDATPPSPLRLQNILRGVSSMSFRRRSVRIAWLLPKPKVLELPGHSAFNRT
jgi:hypothetical protein